MQQQRKRHCASSIESLRSSLTLLKIVVDSGNNFLRTVSEWQKRTDFRYFRIWRLTKLTGFHLAANKSNGIRSVHKLAHSSIPIPAFAALSGSGMHIITTLDVFLKIYLNFFPFNYLYHWPFLLPPMQRLFCFSHTYWLLLWSLKHTKIYLNHFHAFTNTLTKMTFFNTSVLLYAVQRILCAFFTLSTQREVQKRDEKQQKTPCQLLK